MPNKIFIGFCHAMNLGNMFLRNYEEMDGRLWVHIFKGGHEMVFIHGFRWDLFLDDFAENAVRL